MFYCSGSQEVWDYGHNLPRVLSKACRCCCLIVVSHDEDSAFFSVVPNPQKSAKLVHNLCNLITSQIPSHWEIGFQHMNVGKDDFWFIAFPYKDAWLSFPFFFSVFCNVDLRLEANSSAGTRKSYECWNRRKKRD